jgi:hypothetical protein
VIGYPVCYANLLYLPWALGKYRLCDNKPTALFSDNQEILKLKNNPIFHERTKHIDVHCHFIRQLVEYGEAELKYCPTQVQIVDILTKSLSPNYFVRFTDKLSVVCSITIKGRC